MMMMTLMMIVKNALSGKFLRIIGLSANCLLDHMSFLAGDDDDGDDYDYEDNYLVMVMMSMTPIMIHDNS